jgi:hypothetical protein
MRRLAPTLAVLATFFALLTTDCAKALPLRSCPPWFRGLQTSAPFVCADYWWSPRNYCFAMGACYRHYHRAR